MTMTLTLWQTLRRRIRALTHGRFVGADHLANEYFINRQGKRVVEYAEAVPDPMKLPVLWHQWLVGGREQPPTLEQLEQARMQQEQLRERVSILEQADAKLRRQEIAQRRLRGDMDEDTDAHSSIQEAARRLSDKPKE